MLFRQCNNKADIFKQMIYFIRYDNLVKTSVFSISYIMCYNMIADRHIYSSSIVFYNFIL